MIWKSHLLNEPPYFANMYFIFLYLCSSYCIQIICTLFCRTLCNRFIFRNKYVFNSRFVFSILILVAVFTCTGGGGGGGGGGAMVYLCPPLLIPHFYFPLELYVYITLTNKYLAFFIYQLIILWTISINWHRWLLVNNRISKSRYINYVSLCAPSPPPPPTHTHTLFGTFLRHWLVLNP